MFDCCSMVSWLVDCLLCGVRCLLFVVDGCERLLCSSVLCDICCMLCVVCCLLCLLLFVVMLFVVCSLLRLLIVACC